MFFPLFATCVFDYLSNRIHEKCKWTQFEEREDSSMDGWAQQRRKGSLYRPIEFETQS